jgi:hypothetical protein
MVKRSATLLRVLVIALTAWLSACASSMTNDAGDVVAERVVSDGPGTDARADAMDHGEPPDADDVVADAPSDESVDAPLDAREDAPDTDDGDDVTDADDIVADDGVDATSMDAAMDIAADDSPDVVIEPIDAVDVPLDENPDVPPGTCTHPISGVITAPGTYDGTLTGSGTISTTRCLNRTLGPDDVLALHVDARTGVVISADDTRTMVDTVIAIRRACDDVSSEIACNNDDGITRSTASILRTVLDPGDYFVVVDTPSTSGGAYHLDVTTFTPAAGSDCASAIVLTPDTPSANDSVAAGMQSLSCSLGSDGGQTFFAIDVPAMTRVSVSFTPPGFTAALILRALDGCDPRACLDSANADFTAGQVQFANEGTSTRRYYVTVALLSTTRASVGYQLIANFSPTATNATCTSAAPLTPATPLLSQDTGRGGNASTACDPLADGGQLYYSVTIPPGTRADVTAAIASSGRLAVRVLDNCAATTCLANTHGNLNENVVQPIYNEGPVARTVIVSVSGGASTSPVSFDLSVAFVTLQTNAYCPSATALTTTSPVTGQDTTLGGPADTRCLPNRGPELYYAIDVPARTGAEITVQPATRQSASVRTFDACDATACLASAASPLTGTNTAVVWIYNLGATAHTYFVGVSATSPAATTTYGISARFVSLATNADCTMPTPVAAGTVLSAQDTSVGGAPDAHCLAPPSASLYYAVSLPPASRVSIVATPTSSVDRVNAHVFDDCAATRCTDFDQSAADGAPASVIADNPSPLARTVLVAISSARTTPVTFSLAVSTVAIPYRFETFAGICDDLSSVAPVAGITGGDSFTPNGPLPFSFRLFGVDYGNRTISANGFLQLHATSSTFGTAAAINLPIPSNGNPNAVVAPFWDDLDFVAGETTDIREASFGVSPDRHVTYEWNHWTLRSAPSVRLRFQARLYETSSQIEFVYCDITPGSDPAQASGGSATVGLENGTGADGVTYSFNTPGTVRTDTAVRWVPIP